jgi:hypothetical protein
MKARGPSDSVLVSKVPIFVLHKCATPCGRRYGSHASTLNVDAPSSPQWKGGTLEFLLTAGHCLRSNSCSQATKKAPPAPPPLPKLHPFRPTLAPEASNTGATDKPAPPPPPPPMPPRDGLLKNLSAEQANAPPVSRLPHVPHAGCSASMGLTHLEAPKQTKGPGARALSCSHVCSLVDVMILQGLLCVACCAERCQRPDHKSGTVELASCIVVQSS